MVVLLFDEEHELASVLCLWIKHELITGSFRTSLWHHLESSQGLAVAFTIAIFRYAASGICLNRGYWKCIY